MAERLSLYATTTRGTEPLLLAELESLGAKKLRQDRGGVRFLANVYEVARICVHSRIAMRILMPLGEFEVHGADGLYEACSTIEWETWLTGDSTFAVEATLKDSEHNHSGFVALKLKDAIVDRLREKLGVRPNVDSRAPDVSVVAHLAKTTLTLSLDLCGEPLFKRGYRVQSTVAPLKETLAAAMLMAAKYDGETPLCDPMCGSGTLVLEAALIATRRAPGLKRAFSMERWPSLTDTLAPIMAEVRREATAQIRPAPHPIVARDYNEDAIFALRKNVTHAGFSGSIRVEEQDATRGTPPEGPPGLVVTNPPYGERIGSGGQKGMKTFFYALGEAFSGWSGWRLAILAGNPAFESAFHRKPASRLDLFNGPIECQLLIYEPRP